ncbi:MAG: HAD family phosphatase [Acidobacteria bacterium]|nr:MAG: HAD family phosphatase [Acidobacteriota bacterium]
MSRRAVLFDFDGVIANTEPLHLVATQRALATRRVVLSTHEYERRYLGYNDRDLFATLAGDRSLSWTASEIDTLIADKGREFEALSRGESVVYPSAARCIRRLAAMDVPLAIASGAFAHEIEAILDAADLTSHFGAIVGAADYISGKPAPDPFVEAARRLGLSAGGAVAIEDSQWGLDSARTAGCVTVAVTNTYPRHLLSADFIVDSLDEIDEAFLNTAVSSRR